MLSDSGVPEGVVPLFLSSKTQEIFHCRCDEDVTEENPIKIITKQEILDDMRNRAAVCDFHPIKQEVIVSRNISISWNVMHLCVCLLNGKYIYQLYMNIEGNNLNYTSCLSFLNKLFRNYNMKVWVLWNENI